jgi:hypothetical protein
MYQYTATAGSLTISTGQLLLPDGSVAAPSLGFSSAPTYGIFLLGGTNVEHVIAGVRCLSVSSSTLAFFGDLIAFGGSIDTRLYAEAANTLALRNDTATQTFNIYNTYTDVNNYERLQISYPDATTVQIATISAGSGSPQNLRLGSENGLIELASTTANFYPITTDSAVLGGASNLWKTVYIARSIEGSKSKALTEADTTFVTIALPQTAGSNYCGGECIYTVYAADATDFQSISGVLKFAAINKAGAETVTYADVQTTAAVSTGTLTAALSAVAGADTIVLKVNPASSLTQTTLTIQYRLDMPQPNTVTPA